MKKLFFPFALLFLILPLLSLSALDWGLILDQSGSIENTNYVGDKTDNLADGIVYSGSLIPWLSTPIGSAGKLFLSAGVTAELINTEFTIVPQLLRTEFIYNFGEGKELKAGRMDYADPLGFIANGLFDGAQFSFNIGNIGTLGIGAWYTGLLYKRNAKITLSGDDWTSYYTMLDYSQFMDTYFSSRRLIAAVDWDYPDVTDWLRLKAALIGQFDFNGFADKYHSQYLMVKGTIPFEKFVFDLGFCVEMAEIKKEYADSKLKTGFAGELGIGWMPPTAMRDRLTFTGRFSTGTTKDDGAFTAFAPITTETQGDVLLAKLSGLSMLRLDYTARPMDSLTFYIASSYFILSDLGTYKGFPAERNGHFLGNEFSGRLIWSPYSDLRLNLGGGIFLPVLGNTDSKSDPLWRVELSAILVIF